MIEDKDWYLETKMTFKIYQILKHLMIPIPKVKTIPTTNKA